MERIIELYDGEMIVGLGKEDEIVVKKYVWLEGSRVPSIYWNPMTAEYVVLS